MSGTGKTAPVVEKPLVNTPEPVVPVTETDIPADGGFPEPEQPVVAAVEAPKTEAEPDATEPAAIKKSPYQARIDTLTAQKAEKDRVIAEQERELALYKAMAEGKTQDADGNPIPQAQTGYAPGSPEFKRAVAAEAAQIAATEAAKARTDGLLKAGNTEYKDFTDRCNVVASLGAGDRADFMQIVTDPTVISDGHKVIAQLADKPEEAARILALPTVQMTAALVKFQAEIANKPEPRKPISAAPAPIKTVDGLSKGNDEPNEKDDMATYAAKFRAKQAEKMKSGQPARFARH